MRQKFIFTITLLVCCFLHAIAIQVAVTHTSSGGQNKKVRVASEQALKKAIKTARPGDVIIMQNGTWKDINILFATNGLEGQPVTLTAESPGSVIISGKSSLRLSGDYLLVKGLYFKDGYSSSGHVIQFRNGSQVANHCRITELVINRFNMPDTDKSETWVSFFGMHNRVDHSLFQGKTSAGRIMTVWRADNAENRHRIDHNYFKDVPVLGKNGAEVIGVGYSGTSMSDSYTVIEYNLLENCNGEGELIGLKSGRNIVRYNTMVGCQGSISLRHGNHNLVEGNFIFGANIEDVGGIRIMGEDHIVRNNYIQGLRGRRRAALSIIEGVVNSPLHGSFQVKNLLLEGNTLVDNDTNLLIGERYSPERKQTMPLIDSYIRHNVIWGSGADYPLIQIINAPERVVFQGNIVYNGRIPGKIRRDVTRKNPKLTMLSTGMYTYSDEDPLKTNIIGQPLQRNEVGPDWARSYWSELGIQDHPYLDQK